MLKKLNFILSSFIPQKLYWHIAGIIHPWESVIEGVNKPTELYKESNNLVTLLRKLRLINKKTDVLDIGCGVGRLEYALAKKVNLIVGIDIAPSMVALAKKYINAKNVNFIIGNGRNLLDLKDKKFDLIFSIIAFQHMPRDIFKNYINESFQHLKKGGKIFFQIPVYSDKKPPEPPHNHPWAVRSYSFNELEKTLKISGFNKISFCDVAGKKLSGEEYQVFVLGHKK